MYRHQAHPRCGVLRNRVEEAVETEIFDVRPGHRGNRLASGAERRSTALGGHWMSQRTSAFSRGILGNTRFAQPPGVHTERRSRPSLSQTAKEPQTLLAAAEEKRPDLQPTATALKLAGHAYLTQSFKPGYIGFRDELFRGKLAPNSTVGEFRFRQLGMEPPHEGRLVTDATKYQEHVHRLPPTLLHLRRDPIGRASQLDSCYPSDLSRSSRVRV